MQLLVSLVCLITINLNLQHNQFIRLKDSAYQEFFASTLSAMIMSCNLLNLYPQTKKHLASVTYLKTSVAIEYQYDNISV